MQYDGPTWVKNGLLWLKDSQSLMIEIGQVYVTLLKLMVPALIIVKLLEILGGITLLGQWLSPFMQFVGLPQAIGVVWATAILTNVYTAMAVFVAVSANLPLSVAEVSVLGVLILISHSIPVEGAVAKMVGISWRLTISLKLGGGLLLAALVNALYSAMDYQQQLAVMVWQPENTDASFIGWLVKQFEMLISIFLILSALMITLHIMRKLGIEALMQKMLMPVLKLIGITKNASNITIIGITLGLSFGAGLLIAEIKKGKISKKDILLSVSFLHLAHSLIEDTLLILLLGSDLTAILWLRIIFAIVIVFMMSCYLNYKEKKKNQ